MPERVSRCGPDRSSHHWTEVGDRLVSRECHLVDLVWSLSRRQVTDALRRSRSPSPGIR